MKLTAKQKLQKKIDLMVERHLNRKVLNEEETITKKFVKITDDTEIPSDRTLFLIDKKSYFMLGIYDEKSRSFNAFKLGSTNPINKVVPREEIKFYSL